MRDTARPLLVQLVLVVSALVVSSIRILYLVITSVSTSQRHSNKKSGFKGMGLVLLLRIVTYYVPTTTYIILVIYMLYVAVHQFKV